MKFLKENWKMLTIIFLIAILFPIIILYPSDYGVIPHDVGLQIVGYGGSILGGFLTLYGVWWTIKEQKKDLIKQQKRLDDQRREDLAMQYKPILSLKLLNGLINNVPSPNSSVLFWMEIKNIGRGECMNLKISPSNNEKKIFFQITFDEASIISENEIHHFIATAIKLGNQIGENQFNLLPINLSEKIPLSLSISFNDAFSNTYIYNYDIKFSYTSSINAKDIKSIDVKNNNLSIQTKNENNNKIISWSAEISKPSIAMNYKHSKKDV